MYKQYAGVLKGEGAMYHILLVDDESQEREGISWLIGKYHLPLSVAQAADGQKALAHLENYPVDILFTDVKMPFMDGLELASETSKRFPDVKIIMFSAYGEFEYAKRAMEANAVDYLLKPIEVDEFEKVMGKVIGELNERSREKQQGREEAAAIGRHALYKLFTGGQLSAQDQELLPVCFEEIGKKWAAIISLESSSNLFENREDVFLKLAETYLPAGFCYVNLYPDTSWILVFGEQGYLKKDLIQGMEKIGRDVRMLAQQELSAVVSRSFLGLDGLVKAAREVNAVRENYYGGSDEIICLSDTVLNSEYYVAEIEKTKKLLLGAVRQENRDLILLYGNQLAGHMQHGRVVSKIYVYHLLNDILTAFYEQFQDYDKKRMLENLGELLACRSSAQLIDKFREILNGGIAGETGGRTDERGIVTQIKNIVRLEYAKDLNLNDIAGRVNMAPAYISFLFKRETGRTLIRYITDFRMERAREYLEESELKIVQVSRACGYENQPYFNKLFKNYYGVTPGEYRERHETKK